MQRPACSLRLLTQRLACLHGSGWRLGGPAGRWGVLHAERALLLAKSTSSSGLQHLLHKILLLLPGSRLLPLVLLLLLLQPRPDLCEQGPSCGGPAA